MIYLPANISARSSDYTGWAAVRRIDFTGAVLSATATVCLLVGLTWGSNAIYDWSSPQVIGILVAAMVLFGAFLISERFAVEPILPVDLFRNRVFAVASLLSLLQLMVLVGLIVYLLLFLQGVLGVSATDAGTVITPLTLSSVIGAALAGFAITALKRYRVITILSAMQQAQHLLEQVFGALKLSLAFAIQHGLIAVLIFCGAIILATFFLNDVPMVQQPREAPVEAGAVAVSEEEMQMIP